MDIVQENETVLLHRMDAATLGEERARMQMNRQKVGSEDQLGLGPVRKQSLMRREGVRRSKSPYMPVRGGLQRTTSLQSSPVRRPLAPTKSTDAAASLRGGAVQRANSTRALRRAVSSSLAPARRGPPARTDSMDSTHSLRAYRRDQLVNTDGMRGPGCTVERSHSHMSSATLTDMSCLTLDSINLRKMQLIADPLDDNTYCEGDSEADHDTMMSRTSSYTEYLPNGIRYDVHNSVDKNNDFGTSMFDPRGSFSTTASALTTDFTEFVDDEDDTENNELVEEHEGSSSSEDHSED